MGETHSRRSLVPMLGPSIAAPVAEALIERCGSWLGFDTERLTVDEALHVCELIARERGLFGAAGRFAKIRVILEWGG